MACPTTLYLFTNTRLAPRRNVYSIKWDEDEVHCRLDRRQINMERPSTAILFHIALNNVSRTASTQVATIDVLELCYDDHVSVGIPRLRLRLSMAPSILHVGQIYTWYPKHQDRPPKCLALCYNSRKLETCISITVNDL